MPDIVLRILVCLLYLAAAALLVRRLSRGDDYSPADKWRQLSPAIPGVALHVLQLALVYWGHGFDISFYHALSLAALIVVALLLALAARAPIEMLGIGALPIAGLSVLAGTLQGDAVVPLAVGSEIRLHILSSMIAYAVLSMAAMQAILIGVQSHMLHIHQPGGFVRALPPLNAMETLLFQLVSIGFVLLSLGLVTGFVYLEDMFAQHLVHKTVLSIAAWGVFGTLLLGRHVWGWRGQRAVLWTLAGLAFLLLAYFGSKFVLELVLQRA